MILIKRLIGNGIRLLRFFNNTDFVIQSDRFKSAMSDQEKREIILNHLKYRKQTPEEEKTLKIYSYKELMALS